MTPLEVRVEVRPPWPFRLPGGGMDGVLRRRGSVIERLIRVGGEAVPVRVAQPARDRVVFGARASSRAAGEAAIARMRFAVGVDDDLEPFYRAFCDDPFIGASVRRRPWLRVGRRADPWESLAWAITEQLIETERAYGIQRRIIRALGERSPGWDGTPLPLPPTAAVVAGVAPALLQSFDLAAGRAVAMRRAAGEVAGGRVDLSAPDHERGWARLRAIPGIGRWTTDVLGLHGQGRYDVLPAGDLAYLKLVARLQSGGDPKARATEDEVRTLFAPYEGWAGLAGAHALGIGAPRPAVPLAA